MKTARRIFAVALAMILALAVFAFPAGAVDGTMTFSIDTAETTYAPGDTVTVNIYVSSDFNATCMRIPVLYSRDIFELPLPGAERLTAYGDCLSYKNSLEMNTDESETPIDMYNVTDYYDSASYGIVAIQWTASITSAKINSFSSNELVKCFSFQLKVKSDAQGEGTILIPSAEELKSSFAFYNQAIIDATDATTICRVNATFNVGDWTIEVEEGSEDDITTFPGSDVIIDRENMIIKNWFDGMDEDALGENLTTTGIATLQFRANPDSSEYGTGSLVRVWVNGRMTAQYTNLLYGDINGDGLIDAFDKSDMSRFICGLTELSEGEVFTLAADLDQSGEIDAFDTSLLKRFIAGLVEIDQTM